jgi:hypothetical protein
LTIDFGASDFGVFLSSSVDRRLGDWFMVIVGFGCLVTTSAGGVGLLTMVLGTEVFGVLDIEIGELTCFGCFVTAVGWGFGAFGVDTIAGAIASGGVFLGFLTSTKGLGTGLTGKLA